jgi:hypothetical protein
VSPFVTLRLRRWLSPSLCLCSAAGDTTPSLPVQFVYVHKDAPEPECHGRRYIVYQVQYIAVFDDWSYGAFVRAATVAWDHDGAQATAWASRGVFARHVRASSTSSQRRY